MKENQEERKGGGKGEGKERERKFTNQQRMKIAEK